MIALSVTVGIIVSFLLTELSGFLAGGLVVPGYLALYIERPGRIAVTLAIAALSFASVRLLSERIVLFGRRRFMALVFAGMFFSWVAGELLTWLPSTGQDLRAIGYIVPGLIANDAWKQGFLKTCIFCLAAAVATRLIVIALG
jgi:poly-gamma-glutamate biosynthesis protein PgsC/CapC